MEITHDLLLQLGFTTLPSRPGRYVYKGVTGRLNEYEGTFHFHGFSPVIESVIDLRYMLMMIDYSYQPTPVALPIHNN